MGTADLTPAKAAAAARLAMGRRPTPTVHDVALRPDQRALATFKRLQPQLAASYADAALLVAAQQRRGRPLGVCAWHLARAIAQRWQLPAPRYTRHHVALLGEPCGAACRQAIQPRPKPKPTPKPAARATARRRPAARAAAAPSRGRAAPQPPQAPQVPAAALAHYSHLVASAAQPSPARAAYNRERLAALGFDPARWPHLTRARR